MKTLKNILPITLLFAAVLAIGSSCGSNDAPCEKHTYYLDADGDGYGTDEYTIEECEPKDGYVAQNGDCNDNDADIHPGADENPNDGIDSNCDGEAETTIRYIDADLDGYGSQEESAADGVFNNTDCDDTNPAINPGATEIAGNGIDENCDGVAE